MLRLNLTIFVIMFNFSTIAFSDTLEDVYEQAQKNPHFCNSTVRIERLEDVKLRSNDDWPREFYSCAGCEPTARPFNPIKNWSVLTSLIEGQIETQYKFVATKEIPFNIMAWARSSGYVFGAIIDVDTNTRTFFSGRIDKIEKDRSAIVGPGTVRGVTQKIVDDKVVQVVIDCY